MTAIPVEDVDRARSFYEGVLALKFVGGPRADGSYEYESGNGTGLFTYPTAENAGKSPAMLAAWQVDDIEATAKALRDKGVALEEYDLPGLKTERGIATLAGAKALWFKDPMATSSTCSNRTDAFLTALHGPAAASPLRA